jgi:hypothetical protein
VRASDVRNADDAADAAIVRTVCGINWQAG